MNLLDDDGWFDRTHPPPKEGFEWKRKRVSGTDLGASLYELPPDQKTFPYHYELGNDELLVVVAGRPTLRDPTGKRERGPGSLVPPRRYRGLPGGRELTGLSSFEC